MRTGIADAVLHQGLGGMSLKMGFVLQMDLTHTSSIFQETDEIPVSSMGVELKLTDTFTAPVSVRPGRHV